MPATLDRSKPSRTAIVCARLLVGVVSIAVGLMLAEAMVRRFYPQAVHTPNADYVNGIRTYEPNSRRRAFAPGLFDTVQTFGPQRFRGSEPVGSFPRQGTIRIAALGDSFTIGEGVNDDETYPAMLQKALRAANFDVQVINAGVAGVGTAAEALFYDEYVRQFHPDIVLLGVFANDPDDDASGPQMFRRDAAGALVPSPVEMRHRSRFWKLSNTVHHFAPVRWLFSHSSALTLLETEIQEMRAGGSRTSAADAVPEAGGGTLRLTEDEIEWLSKRAQDSSAQLVVVYLPSYVSAYEVKGQPYESWAKDEDRLAQSCAHAAASAGVPFYDLRPYMRRAYAAGHPALYYHGIDEHPNAAGYAAFARGIAGFLIDSGVLTQAQARKNR